VSSSSAIALPIPRLAPVTSATDPLMSMVRSFQLEAASESG
jgi:hypothetical protein